VENNFDFKTSKSGKKTLTIMVISFCCILLFTFIYLTANSNHQIKQQLLNIERNTRVVEIYVNKRQHNSLYARFSNGSYKILEYPYITGDSISKKKGDSIEYIFRKESIIENNLFEEARKNGFLK